MLALRALIAYGYRPALATGRSVPEVRDRCLAFGLVGGVAEYGAPLYYDGESVDLRPPESPVLLDRVRHQLSRCAGVVVDPRYRFGVRARCGTGPLRTEVISEVCALGDVDVRTYRGDSQTDIVVAGIDKGTGLQALAALMADPGCPFAMGDAPPDIPLLACAQLARAAQCGLRQRRGRPSADEARVSGGLGRGVRRPARPPPSWPVPDLPAPRVCATHEAARYP